MKYACIECIIYICIHTYAYIHIHAYTYLHTKVCIHTQNLHVYTHANATRCNLLHAYASHVHLEAQVHVDVCLY